MDKALWGKTIISIKQILLSEMKVARRFHRYNNFKESQYFKTN
jgi:hypothetical protein